MGTQVNREDDGDRERSQPRRVLPWRFIADHHGYTAPECFGCHVELDDWHTLDRCHLVDRVLGGSDRVRNVILLCSWCHATMPSFSDREAALAWVEEVPNYWEELLAAAHAASGGAPARWRGRMLR